VIGVPGSAPLPWQRSQVSTASKLSSTVAPAAAWVRSTSVVMATSPPCTGPVRDAAPNPPRPPPKNASKRSLIEPKPSKFGPIPPERRPSWP
jgi:hypothetical protein